MKKLWKKIGLALMVMTISSQAWSLVLLEPYLGYQFSIDGNASGPEGSEDFSFSGLGAGARLGLNLSQFMFGLSYDWMWFDAKADSDNSELATDQTNFGIFFGGNGGGTGFRYWASYFIDVNNKYTEEGVDIDNSGNGWGFGLGYKFHEYIAANLEYRNWNLDELEVAGVSVANDVTVKGQSIFISISAPFDLGTSSK